VTSAPAARHAHTRAVIRSAILLLAAIVSPVVLSAQSGSRAERSRVLRFEPGVTATIVEPLPLDLNEPIDLILYALPNGNSTAETMGRSPADSAGWRYDIQHIAAQTRALRQRGYPQAVVVYLEADGKSWPAWRARHTYPVANARIVEMVDQLRAAIGSPARIAVTLTGHSGGGSFAFGFIDGRAALPEWLVRIAFLDSNYAFEPRHGQRLLAWLGANPRARLVVLAYDDREIMLDGKKVVSDSGGTWRATERMLAAFAGSLDFRRDTLGAFRRDRASRIELLRHPNAANRILHTEMIGEMNGYMHALLSGRAGYDDAESVLRPPREYMPFVALPARSSSPSVP
jgi:hypothetical protein